LSKFLFNLLNIIFIIKKRFRFLIIDFLSYKINFAPLFFAIIGAQVDLRGINHDVLLIAGILVSIGVGTKIIGCGIP